MRSLALIAATALSWVIPSSAQISAPIPAPSDVVLQFSTDDNRLEYHLGELIPVRFSYTATNPGHYVWVTQSGKLIGGHGLEVSCTPPAAKTPSPWATRLGKFEQMLMTPCGGVGGGGAAGCNDCGGESPLGPLPLSFGAIPLNTYVRFRSGGTFTCTASAANVAAAAQADVNRPALLVASNPLTLTIVEDPGWASSANTSYAATYDQVCRSDAAAQSHQLQCFEVAQQITYMDTVDSLATEVRFFDGKNHRWDNGFWNAILETSYPDDASRLLTARIQQPDVQVSSLALEVLSVWQLSRQSSDPFTSSHPALYHQQAIETLRRFVRVLGDSLPQKDAGALSESLKTYRSFADQHYCENQPLIPAEETTVLLKQLAKPR